MKIRKTSTEKKIKANQKNAKQCTGPKTPRGKWYSRGNSYEHGYFAKVVPMSSDEQHALEILGATIAKRWSVETPLQETAMALIKYCHKQCKAAMEAQMSRVDTSTEATPPEGQDLPEMLR